MLTSCLFDVIVLYWKVPYLSVVGKYENIHNAILHAQLPLIQTRQMHNTNNIYCKTWHFLVSIL
jgi:hypothetical protein